MSILLIHVYFNSEVVVLRGSARVHCVPPIDTRHDLVMMEVGGRGRLGGAQGEGVIRREGASYQLTHLDHDRVIT